jgi:tRNA dimethylallyltransferase
MLAAGLVDELRGLRTRFSLNDKMPSMRSVGYRQAWDCLEGRIDKAELRERGIAATRQLAKRQLTWLRSFRDVETVEEDPRILRGLLEQSWK